MQLLLRDQQKEVSIEVIMACKTFKEALKLCKSISGLEDKQICGHLDIDPAQWARIFGACGHFPENKLIEYMRLCQNITPAIWLSRTLGYNLVPLKNELELENERLRQDLEKEREKIAIITEFQRTIGGRT